MTVDDYNAFLVEFVKLTLKKPRLPKDQSRIDELNRLTDLFQATNPCYHVVCVRECYVGQGVTWMPGDEYDKTWDPERAAAIVKMFDDDSWVGPGAWEIRVDNPTK